MTHFIVQEELAAFATLHERAISPRNSPHLHQQLLQVEAGP